MYYFIVTTIAIIAFFNLNFGDDQWKIDSYEVSSQNIRYNWYNRKKLLEEVHIFHDMISSILTVISEAKTIFISKKNEVLKEVTEFDKIIHSIFEESQLSSTREELIAEIKNSLEVLIKSIESNLVDYKLFTEEYKKNKESKVAIFQAKLSNIILRVNNFFDNSSDFSLKVNNTLDSIIENIDLQSRIVGEYEELAWKNFQQLDELISDKQANDILHQTDLLFKNAQNKKNYLYTSFVSYVNNIIQSVMNSINNLEEEAHEIIAEKKAIQEELTSLKQLMQKDDSDLKIKQEQEREVETKRIKEELLKKEIELEKQKKLTWWTKTKESFSEFLIKSKEFLLKSYSDVLAINWNKVIFGEKKKENNKKIELTDSSSVDLINKDTLLGIEKKDNEDKSIIDNNTLKNLPDNILKKTDSILLLPIPDSSKEYQTNEKIEFKQNISTPISVIGNTGMLIKIPSAVLPIDNSVQSVSSDSLLFSTEVAAPIFKSISNPVISSDTATPFVYDNSSAGASYISQEQQPSEFSSLASEVINSGNSQGDSSANTSQRGKVHRKYKQ